MGAQVAGAREACSCCLRAEQVWLDRRDDRCCNPVLKVQEVIWPVVKMIGLAVAVWIGQRRITTADLRAE